MVDNPKQLLLRNVHPQFFDNGRVGSAAFSPSAEHDFKLSVDNSALSTAAQSFSRHTKQGLASAGVFGVTCEEFENENVEVVDDPIPKNPAHVLADYDEIRRKANSQVKKTGRRLAKLAQERGLLN